MILHESLKAVGMGIVEGLTEFIPVSSTGHLIIAGEFLHFTGEAAKLFEVFIQLGAILAVVWVYRKRIFSVTADIPRDPNARRFAMNIVVAFLPAAVVGVAAHKYIKHYLFNPLTVAAALIAGGLIMILIERRRHTDAVGEMDAITFRIALAVGVAQICALFPGVSRSGATIMGGLLAGMNRKTATEFSFFLAIPTMIAATLFDLLKNISALNAHDMGIFAVGFITAFISALWVIRWLIKFVSHHDFRAFAYYRIAFGMFLSWFFWLRRV